MIHICPSKEFFDRLKEIPKSFVLTEVQDKPSCPLCLLAVKQIYEVIKDNRTQVLVCYLSHICNNYDIYS